ncbi:hypothetical protein [Aquihabitans sp. McL0605]|uniref:HNH endonuclease n=1 Tax=Aquihabitans sp. McL0605 TaxID=3415671 RepID=UPI003CF40EBF
MFDGPDADAAAARLVRAHALVDAVLGLDVRGATGAELSGLLEARAELAAMADGAAVAAVPGWEASGDWTGDGSSTPVTWLVNHTGAGRTTAGALRRTGLLAASMPHVSAAAAAGSLPLSHLHQLTRARRAEVAEVFDRDEALLVTEATGLTADRLAARLIEWRYGALAELGRNDPDRDPGPQTDDDTMTIVVGFQGRGLVAMDLTPESLATLVEALDARIDTWRRTGQLTGDDRTHPQLVAAALLDLIADGSTSSRRGQPRPLVVITATLAALLDHANLTGPERDRWAARILGGGSIGRHTLRELLERANIAFVVTDDDGEPLHVGRTRRLITAAMLTALLARSGGTCEHPGCHANHHRCQAHHLTWWRHGGETNIDNLVLLCKHHHRLAHHGWPITRGPTGLEFRRTNHTPIPPPRYHHTA